MECTHCGHTHINPAEGTIDINKCFMLIQDEGEQFPRPCPCQDFDH